MGILLSYLVFLSTSQYHGPFLKELEDKMKDMDFGFPTAGLSKMGSWDNLTNMLNMSDLVAPNARKWLENRDFKVSVAI